ncbi:hypothetical protein [Halegenticoccus tardaugens]|uniref:hypothetical protein n=1 Tax=Halegenticoccus tardaugens TaxID=2071624 RepID=UPI00100B9C95|nr:hypothetical protein [Halegenticoccus tardaugens]
MEKQPRNPSVTGRARTGRRYWYVLAGQVVNGVVVTVYLSFAAARLVVAPSDLLTGVVLSLASLLSVAVYPSLFKDAIYVNREHVDWAPRWWQYVGVGIGVTFFAYLVIQTVGRDETLAPVALLFVLVAVSSVISAVYLYRRHHAVGAP